MISTIMFLEEGRKLSSLASPILQAKGFRIIDAASGLEAFELLGDARPDLVIVDDKLPDTDGVSWIATMRSLSSPPTGEIKIHTTG